MCQLLYSFTKNKHFTFNNKIYIQNGDVAMGSPLRSLLANVFMAELETALITSLSSKLSSWRCFVDDSVCFVKKDSIKFVLHTFWVIFKKCKVYIPRRNRWKNFVCRCTVSTKQSLNSYNNLQNNHHHYLSEEELIWTQ